MKNLLIITQKVDSEDDLLGFFIDWISEFSKHFDNVFVITLLKGKFNLPNKVHVYSLGKEKNSSKFIRLITFYKLLITLIPKADGVFAHMSPIFAVASWPVTFLLRKRLILWYLHRSVTFRLKLAEILCYKIVTATKASLKIKSNKIIEVGHGIKTEYFKIDRNWNDIRSRPLSILSVGRISPIKNYETLLKSAEILKKKGVDFKMNIVGQPVMPSDTAYFNLLKRMKEKLGLGNEVEFVGFVPFSEVSGYYKNSDLVIGLTPEGGIDKAILEGMASGCITLTSNNACKKYFGKYSDKLIFNYNDSESLAGKIKDIVSLSPENKKEIRNYLVNSVLEHHRLENVIVRITSLYD